MFRCPFHLSFHCSRCDTALSFLSSTWLYASCYALMACAMWSWGSWRGISGFRMVLCWFAQLEVWPCDFLFFPLFLQPHHVKIIQCYHKIIQCYHSCINSPMNWHLLRLCLAALFWVAVFCFVLVVCFWFLFSDCGDLVTAYWTMGRSYTSSLLRPLYLQTATYVLIN